MVNRGKVLSVSIAAYNVENTIERALDSLLVPEIMDDIEIFVVDDGGSDGTLAAAYRYAKKYPGTIIPCHKENGGYGSTINYSLDRASGKYFKQLDGDDWFIKENMLEYISLLKKTNADCVLSEVADFKANSGEQLIKFRFEKLSEGLHDFEDYYLSFVLTMHGTTIKTDILRKHNIRITENVFYSDTELVVFPMNYMDSFYLWKKPLYVYCTGTENQSMSVSKIKKHYFDHEKVYWKLCESYKMISEKYVKKKDLVFRRLNKEAIIHFDFILLLDTNMDHFNEIKEFGNKLKSVVPEVCTKICEERRNIRILFQSGFLLYPIISAKVKYNYNKNLGQ